MRPPEIETPLPSPKLGGRKGKRGGTKPQGRQGHDSAHLVKVRRAGRITAQGRAKRILYKRAKAMHPNKFPSDIYRTVACTWSRLNDVGVHYSAEFGSAHYSGLFTCGSVWACPICAAKIQERRRLEIEQGMEWAEAQGLQAIMSTFTFPHRSFHKLRDLLDKMAEALRYMRQLKGYRALMQRIGFRGLIRSLEVTYGENGWHPHTHELWFVSPEVTSAIRGELVELWAKACRKAGLLDAESETAFARHSVDVQVNATAGDYLAKQDDSRNWGMSHELAKATSKHGRAKGVHPHALITRGEPGDEERYIEYVDAMKGKRQLFWSHGLKAQAGIGEKTDEAIAEEMVAGAELLYTLPPGAWEVVRGNDARAELLEAAEAAGKEGIIALLLSLGYTFRNDNGEAQRQHHAALDSQQGDDMLAMRRCGLQALH